MTQMRSFFTLASIEIVNVLLTFSNATLSAIFIRMHVPRGWRCRYRTGAERRRGCSVTVRSTYNYHSTHCQHPSRRRVARKTSVSFFP